MRIYAVAAVAYVFSSGHWAYCWQSSVCHSCHWSVSVTAVTAVAAAMIEQPEATWAAKQFAIRFKSPSHIFLYLSPISFQSFAFTAVLCDHLHRAYTVRTKRLHVMSMSSWNVLYSLTAALDQLRVVAFSTSNDLSLRSGQHQQTVLLLFFHLLQACSSWTTRRTLPVSGGRSASVRFYWQLQCLQSRCVLL